MAGSRAKYLDLISLWAHAGRMDTVSVVEFVQRHNIAHYVELLKTETDPAKREILQRLLAEERRKQFSHEGAK